MNRTTSSTASIVLTFASFAFAQAPATPGQQPVAGGAAAQPGAGGAAPAQPATRRIAVIPPGFKRAEINGRIAVYEPADEQWVTATLQKNAAATRPATLPVAMLDKLTAKR